MLNELRNLDNVGGKDGILYFLCDVIGERRISIHDAEILCSHRPGHSRLTVSDLVTYCRIMGWIILDNNEMIINPAIIPYLFNKEELNKKLVELTVTLLFEMGVFELSHFWYNEANSFYVFRDKAFPLTFFCIRDILTSQGFFVSVREQNVTHYYIAQVYEPLVEKHCKQKKKQMSIEQLKKAIESNEIAGELAEGFVLRYEKKRLGNSKSEFVKKISDIDVAAGFDIVSFDSAQSERPDRFIEVKAISKDGFFWSSNEYEVAKLRREKYHIYLVDLQRIDEPDYVPEIVTNPAMTIMQSDNWYVETQSYHIKKIL